MAAYVIAQVEVSNPDQYAEYAKLAPPAVEKFGGKYLARGGEAAVLEGDVQLGRVVVLEFASLEQAKACFSSPEYEKARQVRQGAAVMKLIAVQGV